MPGQTIESGDGRPAELVAAPNVSTVSVTIDNGASLSAAIDLGQGRIARIEMPAAWTAAALTFQVSVDGGTYVDLYNDAGTEVSISVAASRGIRTSYADFVGIRYLKIRSGTTGSPVNQGGARVLKLALVN